MAISEHMSSNEKSKSTVTHTQTFTLINNDRACTRAFSRYVSSIAIANVFTYGHTHLYITYVHVYKLATFKKYHYIYRDIIRWHRPLIRLDVTASQIKKVSTGKCTRIKCV